MVLYVFVCVCLVCWRSFFLVCVCVFKVYCVCVFFLFCGYCFWLLRSTEALWTDTPFAGLGFVTLIAAENHAEKTSVVSTGVCDCIVLVPNFLPRFRNFL